MDITLRTIRDHVRNAWAEVAPTFEEGHFECGPIIIMSRQQLATIVREHHDLGVLAERSGDGRLWRDYQVEVRTA